MILGWFLGTFPFGRCPFLAPFFRLLFGFLEAVGLALDGDDFGVVDEAIDQGDDAGGVGEDLVPFGERFVGRNDRGLLLVAARDDLEQQIGMAVGIGEVADLIDDKQPGPGIQSQATAKCVVPVLGGQFVEHGGGVGEQHRMAGQHRLVGDIAGDGGLAHAVGADQYGIGRLLNEPQLQATMSRVLLGSVYKAVLADLRTNQIRQASSD